MAKKKAQVAPVVQVVEEEEEVKAGSEILLKAWKAEMIAIETGKVSDPRIVGFDWWPEEGSNMLLVEVKSSNSTKQVFRFKDTCLNMAKLDDLLDRVRRLRGA